MEYKIIKRIQDRQVTSGYQLLSDEGKVLNIPKIRYYRQHKMVRYA